MTSDPIEKLRNQFYAGSDAMGPTETIRYRAAEQRAKEAQKTCSNMEGVECPRCWRRFTGGGDHCWSCRVETGEAYGLTEVMS